MSEQHGVEIIGDLDFAAKVLQSDLPVIVDFTASWCPPCHALAPVYERLSQEYKGILHFVQLDVDEHQEAPVLYGIQGMPTLVIFHQGKEIGRLIGPHPARLKQSIERVLVQHGLLTNSHSGIR